MRILWVKANKILPVRSGGDIRSFNLVKHLAKRDELIFLSYYDGAADGEYEKELQQYLPGAICVATESGRTRCWRDVWTIYCTRRMRRPIR